MVSIRKGRVDVLSLSAITALCYFIFGQLSIFLLHGQKIINIGIFFPEGIALALALYFGKRVVPGIFIGQWMLAYYNGIGWLPAMEIATINSIEALIAIRLAEAFRLNLSLHHFRDLAILGGMIVVVLQPFSALLSNTFLLLHHQIESTDFFRFVFSWWFGNVMAQLLVTPFLLSLLVEYERLDKVGLVGVELLSIGYIYVLEIIFAISNPFVLLLFTLPYVVAWVVYRGVLYGETITLLFALVSAWEVYRGEGLFSAGNVWENTIDYNFFILLHIVTVLLIGVVLHQRKAYAIDLERQVDDAVSKSRKQQVLMLQQNRLAQMGEVLNLVAHQWRQPLNTLAVSLQVFRKKCDGGDLSSDEMRRSIERMQNLIQMMSHTIDDFRDFFKPNRRKERMEVEEIVNSTLELVKFGYENHGIEIRLNIRKMSPLYVMGFPSELVQVLINILNNAKDMLKTKKTDDKTIWIEVYDRKSRVVISICDNGGGIDPSVEERLFDPYVTTKSDQNGTGLGLYMSKTIIEEHFDGKIEAETRGDNACFTITLPKVF